MDRTNTMKQGGWLGKICATSRCDFAIEWFWNADLRLLVDLSLCIPTHDIQ